MAIAYDSRNNSKLFATPQLKSCPQITSGYFYLKNCVYSVLSFAVRELKCHSGIVITASHNPKEYNGYKFTWKDGGQLVAPA